jgi:hypothetical protein
LHIGRGNLDKISRSGEDSSELTDSLKSKIVDAVLGVRKKERGRVDRDSGIFSSGTDTPDRKEINDKTSYNNIREQRCPPSLRLITRQKQQSMQARTAYQYVCSCKLGLSALPSLPCLHTRGLSLDRGLERRRRPKDDPAVFKHSSVSPTNHESSLGHIRSSRLDKIAYCHHIPRVSPARSLLQIKHQQSFQSTRLSQAPSDSGQDSLSDDSASDSDLLCFTSSSSVSEEEVTSMSFIPESKIMHSYIASRGQREREMEIYEVKPPTPYEVQ